MASTPDLAGTPGTPEASLPGTDSASGEPPEGGPVMDGFNAPKMPPMPTMPNISLDNFKMSGFMEAQMEHHKKHHLDADGNCDPKLKEEGMKYMKKFTDQ